MGNTRGPTYYVANLDQPFIYNVTDTEPPAKPDEETLDLIRRARIVAAWLLAGDDSSSGTGDEEGSMDLDLVEVSISRKRVLPLVNDTRGVVVVWTSPEAKHPVGVPLGAAKPKKDPSNGTMAHSPSVDGLREKTDKNGSIKRSMAICSLIQAAEVLWTAGDKKVPTFPGKCLKVFVLA